MSQFKFLYFCANRHNNSLKLYILVPKFNYFCQSHRDVSGESLRSLKWSLNSAQQRSSAVEIVLKFDIQINDTIWQNRALLKARCARGGRNHQLNQSRVGINRRHGVWTNHGHGTCPQGTVRALTIGWADGSAHRTHTGPSATLGFVR